MLATVGASIFAYLHMMTIMGVVSACAAGMTSWSEFLDLDRKLQRYTNAVKELEKLKNWWYSLTEVEQASLSNVAHLVETGESIICGEHKAWRSALTPSQKGMQKENGEDKKAV